jgi:hypothetical protein
LASILRYLNGLRSSRQPIHWLKLHGGPHQMQGTPDLHVTYRGMSYWLEVKRPGAKATPLQEHRLSQWRAAGATTGVVESLEEFKDILGAA